MTNNSVLAAAVLLAFSSTSLAGVTFTQITTVDGKRTSVSKVAADGGNAKIEIVETQPTIRSCRAAATCCSRTATCSS